VGTTGFLHPSPVFPDEARVQENQQFPQIQELFLDSPILMHRPIISFLAVLKIKNPRTDYLDPGISLFYPQDLHAASDLEGCSEKSRQVF
jgi:hypothetical protein